MRYWRFSNYDIVDEGMTNTPGQIRNHAKAPTAAMTTIMKSGTS